MPFFKRREPVELEPPADPQPVVIEAAPAVLKAAINTSDREHRLAPTYRTKSGLAAACNGCQWSVSAFQSEEEIKAAFTKHLEKLERLKTQPPTNRREAASDG